MNVAIQKLPKPERPVKRQPVDNEFLPAALEILETPASPTRTAFIWFICILCSATILWSYFGTFDIVSTAQGKIQPTGRVKIIQALEMGKTRSVPVTNGSEVKAGDILVELDATELQSDELAASSSLASYRGELVRRNAVLAVAAKWQTDGIWNSDRLIANDPLPFADGTPVTIRNREQLIYAADLSQLDTSLDNLAAQRQQQQATINRLTGAIAAHRLLIATLAERVAMRSSLMTSAAGSRAGLIDAMEGQQKEESDLAEQLGQLEEARAAFVVATTEGNKTLRAFIADNVVKEGDASRQVDQLEQQLVKAEARREAMTIKSPIDGVVQTSAITTIGQVVSAGTELMRVVPKGAALEIEAYIPNSDIGFVSVGQEAVIKVEAFPFTRYGIISGHVTEVGTDAIPEPDAQALEGQPAKELQSLIPIGNVQRVQNLVFPVTIRPDVSTINVDGKTLPLSSGMATTVEIKTGKRRILEYLFSPLAEITSEAMQER
ncbi:HlyD family type I secretion periplasmic adaptor subunit [Rhizobium sp. HT1-10]|uniref:HlyD family type I secretion periplasmic adaptor subunit n=1 Tax=Rhizobium sp. HT1-10 TaxID=3111638 RepID=UPI003C1ECE84